MNKERFNQLVKDYSNLDSQNKDLESLVLEFPYSQPVMMLNLKSSSSLTKKEYQQKIALAAFYSTDRNVLRSLIEKGKVPSDFDVRPVTLIKKKVTVEKKSVAVAETPIIAVKKHGAAEKLQVKAEKKLLKTTVKPQPEKPIIADSKAIDAKHLRDEVLANLEILKKTKADFLKLAEFDDNKEKKARKTAAKNPASEKKVVEKQASKPSAETPVKTIDKTNKSPRTKKNELIDKFIAEEPSITPGKAIKENQSDLSKASSELKEDLVSENLAIIFAKQGKASKAIEIYKKLIWKFPQKKASFAARIEELKKK